MIRNIRKLAERDALIPMAAFAGIFLAWYVIGWPVLFFQGDARWVGEAFWIILLLLSAMLILAGIDWNKEEWKRRTEKQEALLQTESVGDGRDKHEFKEEVRKCLDDRSIIGYFKRKLVDKDAVIEVLVNGYAFQLACETDSYKTFVRTRSKLENLTRKNSAISCDAFNFRTVATFVCISLLIPLIFTEISQSNLATLGITFTSIIFIGLSSWFFSETRHRTEHRLRRQAFSLLALCISLCLIISPSVLFGVKWDSIASMIPIWLVIPVLFYILPIGRTISQCLTLLGIGAEQGRLLFLRDDVLQFEKQWIEGCEDIIKEQANWTINTILGKDKDLFLVEQDSQGLRKLQDPSYTVSTQSEYRIASALAQMDAGSIALALRGAGKSTLLRKLSGPLRSNIDRDLGISLYLTAPAEYIPRDFIAAFFQQLCEAYLIHEQRALPRPIDKEWSKLSSGQARGSVSKFLWLFVRTAIYIAIIAWIMRSLIGTHYHHIYEATLIDFKHWCSQIYHFIDKNAYKRVRPYWAWIRIPILVFAAICLLSNSGRWKKYIKPRREPALAKTAREYLRRLQVERTVTWGRGANIGTPAMRGVSLNLNRGGTASYIPWTLPDLVAHTRRFMQAIAQQFPYSNHAIVVGIDEIDRIGSLEHAEKFVGEIKAIFGVEKCFFLVAVAEDVGSVFAQRATAGRSILENAFDDIILVDPLDFEETRDLLLKRVPGFTDSFVYLVHALSGGLPRELIRIARRLVDVNQEASTENLHPRLEHLAFCLVKEELIEAIRATRNQLARLMLHSNWTSFFEKLHSASTALRYASPFSVDESRHFIEELSELIAPGAPERVLTRRELVMKDEDEAGRIIRDFTAFSYFGLTIIEAFSDKFFDLEAVKQATANGSEGSYERLAVARAELIVSPENSRAMLRQFHDFLASSYNP